MGLTVVDAGVLIGLLDQHDAHHDAAKRALDEARDRVDTIVVPASALDRGWPILSQFGLTARLQLLAAA